MKKAPVCQDCWNKRFNPCPYNTNRNKAKEPKTSCGRWMPDDSPFSWMPEEGEE